jgi:MoaA/NifB/PqqE/SkfB family radical SAM enzyme
MKYPPPPPTPFKRSSRGILNAGKLNIFTALNSVLLFIRNRMPDSLVYSKLLVPLRVLYGYIARNRKRKQLHFEVHIAEQCNLNCAGCLHFSPLAPKQFLDIEKYKNDCKRIAVLTGGIIERIDLLGGEPLLNSDIIDIVKISRSYFPERVIRIITNGTLLKNQSDEFWDCCHVNNIIIMVSIYPINIDYDFIINKAKSHRVRIDFRGDTKVLSKSAKEFSANYFDSKWLKFPIDIEGRQNPVKNAALCPAIDCFQLVEGKLYKCAPLAYVKYFNSYFDAGFEITEDDYIDIYKAKNVDEILDKLRKPAPFCRYCKTEIPQYIKWKTTKKEISAWKE